MAVSIVIPKLGVEMTSAKIAKWELAEGAKVEANQVVATIETDKLANDLEAAKPGFLHHIGEEGGEYGVMEVIGQIAETEAEYQALASGGKPAASEAKDAAVTETAAVAGRIAAAGLAGAEADHTVAVTGKPKASPLAKAIAKKNGIDLSRVTGTGAEGVILKRDVISAIEQKAAGTQAGDSISAAATEKIESGRPETPPASPSGASAKPADGKYGDAFRKAAQIIPMTGIQKVTAQKVHDSLIQAAQMTGIQEIDVTNLVSFRKETLEFSEQLGYRLTYTDIFIKAIASAAKEVPIINSSLIGDEIVYWEDVNVSCGIALPDGNLTVGVVHKADSLSLGSIHRRMEELIERAKSGKLTLDDMSGGTITLSNFGSFGTECGTPVLVIPEVCLVGPGAIVRKPIVRNEEIVIADTMKISTTVDHRVINGKPGGEFSKALIKYLQNPRMLSLQ